MKCTYVLTPTSKHFGPHSAWMVIKRVPRKRLAVVDDVLADAQRRATGDRGPRYLPPDEPILELDLGG